MCIYLHMYICIYLYVEDGTVGQREEDGVALVALVLVSIFKRRQDRVLPFRILGQGGRVRRDAELGRLHRLLLWFQILRCKV